MKYSTYFVYVYGLIGGKWVSVFERQFSAFPSVGNLFIAVLKSLTSGVVDYTLVPSLGAIGSTTGPKTYLYAWRDDGGGKGWEQIAGGK